MAKKYIKGPPGYKKIEESPMREGEAEYYEQELKDLKRKTDYATGKDFLIGGPESEKKVSSDEDEGEKEKEDTKPTSNQVEGWVDIPE